ncbi:M17 family metallopeptidase [Dyadobacter sp. NIV53]|uniref:leucyl aminopeptidase family protein n=1 Tax=Dyadobacter sp. NIV53 TaxID=2861765 RepID=UPI001E2B1941|nr:M17 family metallopeptidase [Dyadobacter sp. NIV53]
MDLMNAPGNYKTPDTLAEWALESGRKNNYKVSVFDKETLLALGMHALLSVSKGSDQPPVMIVTDYQPEKYEKTIALVGKGVTFDTGGISIKGSANMHLMKSDMGGAGAVLGIVELAAQLKLPVRIIGVIPSTENCVDGSSTKPGDVIGSYSGKTIEVIDTDAEGRLILADGLSYAVRQYKPDVVIDLATLTGSVIQTLGYEAAGLFTPNDSLANELTLAGEKTGERLWRLPVWDEYKEEISSDVADLKNYHGKPLAGAIVAAKFLEVFTDEHTSWAHLDIAGTAFGDIEFAPGRSGTAYGVRLLREFLMQQ